MAFVPWKDRVTSTPHRYKLTQVSADTYDLTAVPGAIGEAGTPVNAANLNKLIQRDGDDIKDTVTTFTEASSRANIGTGEKTSTIFGKVKKYFTDLKTHAFTTPSATQSTSADTVPSSKLLKESSFARVYREATELSGVTYPISIENLLTAILAANPLNSMFIIGVNNAAETKVTGLPSTYGALTIIVPGETSIRMRVEFSKEIGNGTALMWLGSLIRSGNTVTSVTWKQIIDDSSAQTISGVKTYTASPIVPTTPSGPSAAVSKTYADSVGFARVYREATEISGITYPVAIGVLCKELSDRNLLNTYMVIGCSAATEDKVTGLPTIGETPQTYGQLIIRVPGTSALRMDIEYTKHTGTGEADIKWIGDLNRGTTPWTVNWKMIIDDGSAQNITGVKTFATGATPLITDAPTTDLMAVNKAYVDGLSTPYDKVIRTQSEFNELIASPNWLGATSVALVGQFTLSTANNSGIKIPATVKQIHGFNGAKITITNFKYNSSTAKGGLWYNTLPTTLDYSIRDLEVDCTGTDSFTWGFFNCTNLTNCTGKGTGRYGYGFSECTNLANCTGTGTGTGINSYGFYNCTNLANCRGTGTGTVHHGHGFFNCTNLTNCTGKGTGINGYGFRECTNLTNCRGTGTGTDGSGCGFYNCTYLTNCTGTGTGAYGYGFYGITYASNCKDGGSKTDMWGGTNTNIDVETCRKTLSTADNTTLNT